jgi:hypothetical protein
MFKNQKSQNTVLIVLLLAVFVFAGVILKIRHVSAGSMTIGFTQPDLTNIDFEALGEKVSANEITIRLLGAHQNGDYFQVDLCYPLPDDRDWLLTDKGNEVSLSLNKKTVYPIEEGTIDWVYATDGVKTERCEYLLFPVVIGKDETDIKLTVSQISISEPEILDCPNIQKKLNEANSGVTIECFAGEGNSGIKILENSTNMTETDVRELVHKIIVDAQTGPWEFIIKVPNP